MHHSLSFFGAVHALKVFSLVTGAGYLQLVTVDFLTLNEAISFVRVRCMLLVDAQACPPCMKHSAPLLMGLLATEEYIPITCTGAKTTIVCVSHDYHQVHKVNFGAV